MNINRLSNICIVFLIVVILSCCYSRYNSKNYKKSEYTNFSNVITLNDTNEITSKAFIPTHGTDSIKDPQIINDIIDTLNKQEITERRKGDNLPNFSPEIFMVFNNSEGDMIYKLEFHSSGYFVAISDNETLQSYKFKNEKTLDEIYDYIGLERFE